MTQNDASAEEEAAKKAAEEEAAKKAAEEEAAKKAAEEETAKKAAEEEAAKKAAEEEAAKKAAEEEAAKKAAEEEAAKKAAAGESAEKRATTDAAPLAEPDADQTQDDADQTQDDGGASIQQALVPSTIDEITVDGCVINPRITAGNDGVSWRVIKDSHGEISRTQYSFVEGETTYPDFLLTAGHRAIGGAEQTITVELLDGDGRILASQDHTNDFAAINERCGLLAPEPPVDTTVNTSVEGCTVTANVTPGTDRADAVAFFDEGGQKHRVTADENAAIAGGDPFTVEWEITEPVVGQNVVVRVLSGSEQLAEEALNSADLANCPAADDEGGLGGTADIQRDKITRDGCTVTIPVQRGSDEKLTLWVFDEGNSIYEAAVPAGKAGSVVNVTWTIKAEIGADAPGVAFGVGPDEGDFQSFLDGWDFPGSAEVSAACAETDGQSDQPPPYDPLPSKILADEITRDGCEVTIWVEHGDNQQKTVQIWDDGELIDEASVLGSGDSITFAKWTIKHDFMTGAPGVGMVLVTEDGMVTYDEVGVWDFPGSSEVAKACALSGGKSDKLPPKPVKHKKVTGLPDTGN
ncbi:hypothetical protein [Enemella sp. A6]|uniref:hypothetical protein n=1 Tax=Enemella sp. A6 TaxID=3440152 RepID=UPI003EC05DA8